MSDSSKCQILEEDLNTPAITLDYECMSPSRRVLLRRAVNCESSRSFGRRAIWQACAFSSKCTEPSAEINQVMGAHSDQKQA